MASPQVEEIKNRYQVKMITELNKFLKVYNELTGKNVQFSVGDYPTIVRIIGNYVSTLNIHRYLDTNLEMNDQFSIEMKVFEGTPYESKVKQFLIMLKDAFHDSLYDDMIQFLHRTDEFTREEKVLCRAFLEKLDTLNNAMKRTMFEDVSVDTFSRKVIQQKYNEELRAFNEYTREMSSDRDKARIIHRFDMWIKKVASEKVPSEIFFDA